MFGWENGVYVLTKQELIGEFRLIGSFSACVWWFCREATLETAAGI